MIVFEKIQISEVLYRGNSHINLTCEIKLVKMMFLGYHHTCILVTVTGQAPRLVLNIIFKDAFITAAAIRASILSKEKKTATLSNKPLVRRFS